MPELVIEFPSVGKTYSRDEYGVYEYSVYGKGSILEGQEKRTKVGGGYETLEAAKAAHPKAEWHGEGSRYREIHVPETPPAWFDRDAAGEVWGEDDY